MPKKGHRPQRTCVGCGARDEKSKLIRIIVGKDGDLQIDKEDGGRGGYLHRAEACWREFVRKKSLYRTFRVEIGRSAKEKIIKGLKERNRE